MPEVLNEQKLKQGFISLNKKLLEEKYKQYVLTDKGIKEEDFFKEENPKTIKNLKK